MERLWSRAVATSGNQWQIGSGRKRLNRAKTVAVDCDQLPCHGKEGVNGSSPLEGFAKFLLISPFGLRERRQIGGLTSTQRPPISRSKERRSGQILRTRSSTGFDGVTLTRGVRLSPANLGVVGCRQWTSRTV